MSERMDIVESEPQRFYGVDVTDELETIAEATLQPDGTIHVEIVILDTEYSA